MNLVEDFSSKLILMYRAFNSNIFLCTLLFVLISCDFLFDPSKHGESRGIAHPDPIGSSAMINASEFSSWVHYKFNNDTLQLVPFVPTWLGGDFNNTLSWDIAFQRNHIRTNSGSSGIGEAGAYVDSSEAWNGSTFNAFMDSVHNFTYLLDDTLNTFYNQYDHTFSEGSTNPALETWARIDTSNNYTMNISNYKMFIRTADGKSFYKFWPYDYYDENSNSGFISIIYELVCKINSCGICILEDENEDDCD